MPGRFVPLVNEQYYHIFNRGSDKRNLFLQNQDYNRFIKTLYYYHFSGQKIRFSNYNKSNINFLTPLGTEKLVDIICYCLMPNHFHLLLKQKQENGISKFLSQISNSYTKYFNTKNKRIGALLQGTFKAVLVENDEQFLHVSRYIHLNPIVSSIIDKLEKYPWSSYQEYKTGSFFCKTEEVLNFFKTNAHYLEFLNNQIEYGKSLELIKHHLLDDD